MFRGGAVDSRGTGITSGLMDTPKYATGGRVGYQSGDLVLGGDLYTKDDYTKFITNYADQIKSPALYQSIFTKDDDGNIVVKEDSDFSYENLFGKATGDTKKEDRQSVYTNLDSKIGDAQSSSFFFPPPRGTEDLAKAIKSDVTADLKASKQFEVPPARGGGADLGMSTRKEDPPPPNTNNNNQEETTEIDPKTLMKENAELFKELLGEGNEKKLRDARIQDASDYLLKFFEGSQKEGATVGSSGAEVAAFATSRPSKTEQAKAAIEKGDQTAIALAINDYIAGKRSKEQIDLMEKKLGANFAQQIALIEYKNKKDTFVDIVGELGKGMSNARAIASAVQKAFGKVPISLNETQSGANLAADRENLGKYFILSDGTVKTVIESTDGNLIEDIIYSPSGITVEG
jgi:hypothetical protein